MKNFVLCLLVAVATLLTAPRADATVLHFDDLGDGLVPATYGGLDWSQGDWFAFGEPQDPYTAHSGDVRVVSGFGDPDSATAILFSGPSTFQGAWFAGLQGATLTFQMYHAGQLVATSSLLDPSSTPQFLASGYDGLVDRLVISSPGQGSFVMDDFTFSAVPEPETLLLMLGGLGVLAIGKRRTSRRLNA